jgi:hypothetical protein
MGSFLGLGDGSLRARRRYSLSRLWQRVPVSAYSFRRYASLLCVSLLFLSAGCTKRPPKTSTDEAPSTTQEQKASPLSGTIKLSWSLNRTWTNPPHTFEQHLEAEAKYQLYEPKSQEPNEGVGGTYAATAFVHGTDKFTITRPGDLCGDGTTRTGEYNAQGDAFLDGGGDKTELQLISLGDNGTVRDDRSILLTGGAGKVSILLGELQGRTTVCGKERASGSMPIEQVILETIPELAVPQSGPGHWYLERDVNVRLYAANESGSTWYAVLAPYADYENAKVVIDLWQQDPKCTSEPVKTDRSEEKTRKFAMLRRGNAIAQRSSSYKSVEQQLGDHWDVTVGDAPFEDPTNPATQAATYPKPGGGAITAFPESNGFTLRDEFDTAVTLAHEQQHAVDIDASGGLEKLATVTTADQFVALYWELEARGFRAEESFLQALVAQDPSYAKCRDKYIESKGRRGKSEAEKDEWLTRRYRESQIREIWEKHHSNPPDAKAQTFVESLPMDQISQHWSPYIGR